MSLFNLLESTATDGANSLMSNWPIFVIGGLVIVMLFVSSFISGKQRKKQQAEEQKKRDSMHPGCIVMTIGCIKGTVVEVDDINNTFVLETGKSGSGNYIQFDKQAICQITDPFETTANGESTETAEPFTDDKNTEEELQKIKPIKNFSFDSEDSSSENEEEKKED